jgi:tetratricopeptide (TPR) repeat protein
MIKARHRIVAVLLAAVAASMIVDLSFSAAQNVPSRPSDSQADLLEVPQPDLDGVDPPAAKQIHDAQAGLADAMAQTDASRSHRAEAFGSLGQVYQAYGFNDAALACYTNAARLDSRSFRWSYYLGYLHQTNGDAEAATRDYQRALILKPTNSAAQLRFGNLELTLNQPDAAKQLFTKAMAQPNSSAAALSGLGKVALLERQYGVAQKYFAEALAREPQASGIHYQLAMAYRGLGDLPHMQEQLQARGDVEPAIQDPLLDEIDALKHGVRGLMERAGAAMKENRFADAVSLYRQLVLLNPSDPLPYMYLGIALAKCGKPDEALKQYAHASQLDPSNANVHYNMGILLVEGGKEEQAIPQFQQAIQLDPGLVAAHLQLANLLMRKRQDADAEREYGVVISLEPQNGFARFMQAMAAVHSGSYARARTLLEEAASNFPGDADIANALARILAAAPDPAVRDPGRALHIVETLVNNQQGDALEVGITLAMALAAVGRFQEAAGYQEAIIKQLEASRQYDLAHLLRPNLARYQQGKTCLAPWASDDPIFAPVPSKAQLSTEAKTMDTRP